MINNWEATYFDFDAAKLLALAQAARSIGVELFVLDDGWFGRRDNDRSSLGDWQADTRWTARAEVERATWDAHVDGLRTATGMPTYAGVVGVVNEK